MWCCSINHNGRKCNCKAEFKKIEEYRKYIKALRDWDRECERL